MAPSVPSFRQDKLPYRVIDVDATLSSNGRFRFCQADCLSDFCVISHTWNDYVFKLMTEITATAKELNLSYPQAVTEKNWADHHLPDVRHGYLSIQKFLEILQAQGVKKVWMDMLCIDQSEDSKEKSREIPLMGPYYRHSSACYVPINGFGFNYELRMGEHLTKCIPWLNRVWTLQELLLPQKIYFLVELENWMEICLAGRVATAAEDEDLSHFCSCCQAYFMLEDLKKISEKMQGVNYQVGRRIREADLNQTCKHCGSPPLLRKANQMQDDCKLYLIQKEALSTVASIARFHERVQRKHWNETPEEQKNGFHEWFSIMERYAWLLDIMDGKDRGNWFHTFVILRELRYRQCTKERDFLLGVVGLLGVNAVTNNQLDLTTLQSDATTPEEELVKLASSGGFAEQLLVELCGMNIHSGRFMPNMSWILDLTLYGSDVKDYMHDLYAEFNMKEFQSLAANVSVAPEGPITMTVKVLKGYVNYEDSNNLSWKARFSEHDFTKRKRQSYGLHFNHALHNFREYDQDMFSYSNQFTHEEVRRFNQKHKGNIIDREARAYAGKDGSVEELVAGTFKFNEWGTFRLPLKELASFHGFEMWLLYLGQASSGMAMVLFCLHKPGTGNVVHMIGSLHASYLGVKTVLDALEDPPYEITIAGYGKYLDNYVIP